LADAVKFCFIPWLRLRQSPIEYLIDTQFGQRFTWLVRQRL